MEIINYVQKPEKHNFVGFLQNRSDRYSPKRKARSAGSSAYIISEKHFSFRRLFAGIWRAAASTGSFFTRKIKIILTVLGILFLAGALTGGAIYLYLKITNHTGPITFCESEKNDYDSLDKLMASFAMDSPTIAISEEDLMDAMMMSTIGVFTQGKIRRYNKRNCQKVWIIKYFDLNFCK